MVKDNECFCYSSKVGYTNLAISRPDPNWWQQLAHHLNTMCLVPCGFILLLEDTLDNTIFPVATLFAFVKIFAVMAFIRKSMYCWSSSGEQFPSSTIWARPVPVINCLHSSSQHKNVLLGSTNKPGWHSKLKVCYVRVVLGMMSTSQTTDKTKSNLVNTNFEAERTWNVLMECTCRPCLPRLKFHIFPQEFLRSVYWDCAKQIFPWFLRLPWQIMMHLL